MSVRTAPVPGAARARAAARLARSPSGAVAFAGVVCALLGATMPNAARADCSHAGGSGRIFYVTDRAPLGDDQLFSGERGLARDRNAVVTYGTIAAPAKRATDARCASRTQFLATLATKIDRAKPALLLYVPGYYTSFRAAVDDAFAIQTRLSFPGPVIAYAWPSKVTSRLTYVNDESNASWSLGHFRALLDALSARYPTATVSFAAHSLGARFAAEGIAFVRRGCAACVGRAAFFAPDIDGDTLHAELAAAGRCRGRPPERPVRAAPVALYVSNRDLALRQSQRLHGHQRAGQAGSEIVLCGGVDTIDVGYTRFADKTGHGYHVDPRVVADVRAAFAGTPPSDRARALTRATRAGGVYYELRR